MTAGMNVAGPEDGDRMHQPDAEGGMPWGTAAAPPHCEAAGSHSHVLGRTAMPAGPCAGICPGRRPLELPHVSVPSLLVA